LKTTDLGHLVISEAFIDILMVGTKQVMSVLKL